ncbi:hypothetical protein [uncultured Pseudokineococcus sp.]|uniref:hypothetical protein n=1 Tax=uncultured Pseudokineococcus sp. TaxID=1642928 RepID=UPI00262B8B94|nr:hypothetical protein [uncultured Pseudokineococcus sp.]
MGRDVEWAGYRPTADEPGSGFVVRGGTAYLSGPWIYAAVGPHADLRELGWGDGTVWVAMEEAAFRARGDDTDAVAQISKELPEPGATSVVDMTVEGTSVVHLDLAAPFGLGRRWDRCSLESTADGRYRFVSIGSATEGPTAVFSYDVIDVPAPRGGTVLTMEEALAVVRATRSRRTRRTRRPRLMTVGLLAPSGHDDGWTLVVTGRRGDVRRRPAAGHELDVAVRQWLAERGDGALPLELDTSSDELSITSSSRELLEELASALTAEHDLG